MKEIHIYSKSYCPFCRRAIELLNIKGISFKTIDVTDDLHLEEEMRLRSGQNTVPQIFIGPRHIGGCNDLFTLDELGQLDSLLAQASL